MEKVFTQDWFSHNIHNWSIFLSRLKGKQDLNFLEIGSYEGRATCWLLDEILTDKTSKITCIDTFEGGFEHTDINFKSVYDAFLNNIDHKKDQVAILKGKSFERLLELQNNKEYFDFIYIDGSHESKHVLQDAILSFEILKSGGIMIFDDYLWGDPAVDATICPRPAVDAFMVAYAKEIQVLSVGYQVVILKKIGEYNDFI